MQELIDNITSEENSTIVAIILESTEMPALANSIRKFTGLPVWDVSTLGRCLVASAKTFDHDDPFIGDAVFNNGEFRQCMMEWYTEPTMLERRFGEQDDGKLKHYEDQGLSLEQLASLACWWSARRRLCYRPPNGRLRDGSRWA